MTDVRELTFTSAGTTCAATHLVARGTAFAGSRGRPCVVMAHGFGGTRDTGLLGYASGLADAGLHVLLFDYRGFGGSAGAPRQRVSWRHQRADYQAAIDTARSLPDVDRARIALWGTSYSGGHVVAAAARDGRVAATISLTPALDGRAALASLAARHPALALRLVGHGLRDLVAATLGRPPHLVPIVGPAGSTVMIPGPGAWEGYQAIAGPSWRNQVTARSSLEVAFNRPCRHARGLGIPMLLQVGELDGVAPPSAAYRTAKLAEGNAELLTYPVDHFDVYEGPWQERALADQLDFLRRVLPATRPTQWRTS